MIEELLQFILGYFYIDDGGFQYFLMIIAGIFGFYESKGAASTSIYSSTTIDHWDFMKYFLFYLPIFYDPVHVYSLRYQLILYMSALIVTYFELSLKAEKKGEKFICRLTGIHLMEGIMITAKAGLILVFLLPYIVEYTPIFLEIDLSIWLYVFVLIKKMKDFVYSVDDQQMEKEKIRKVVLKIEKDLYYQSLYYIR